VLAVLAVTWLEVHAVLGSRIPGRPVEAAALVLAGAAAVAFALVTVGCRAADRLPWADALRTAARLSASAPATVPLAVTALACVAVLVAVVPAFAGFIAGPLAYAVSVTVVRAAGRERAAEAAR
jgi:hypothetical protein